ncbi:hypothetical protein FUAX_23350 [Fulvitalea axinellae]|uniref:META domain-containing protein n=1 Tax=Fulvitalea axinellae TaxID=1182444 RepID=A0AAU9CPC8_9BACT|nr:hypothetical protein FUAX_23350 [Fulvitalea axinellae]
MRQAYKNYNLKNLMVKFAFLAVLPIMFAFSCDEDGTPTVNNLINGSWYVAEIVDEDFSQENVDSCPDVEAVFQDGNLTLKIDGKTYNGTYKVKLEGYEFEIPPINSLKGVVVSEDCPINRSFIDKYQTLYKVAIKSNSVELYYGEGKYFILKKK